MGGSRPSPPTIVYSPPPPPPPPPTPVPTQSVQTQTALNEVSGAQQRLNMEMGAQLDRTNAEFFAGQDIRRTQSAGAEQRLSIAKTGEEERASRLVAGEQERLGIAATGTEYRAGLQTAGAEERLGIAATGTEQRLGIQETGKETRATARVTGEEQRAAIRETGSETRVTDLQQEMFRRYKENRDYEQAQQQYRT